jgi:peptide/nickel transport system permease protein
MRTLLRYALRRFGQFVLVVFVGINLAFFITHATPIDPIQQAIAAATRFSQADPRAVEATRVALRELYGLNGTLWDQYLTFWKRIVVFDFGPSLSAFPTPVSTLIWRALPWTFGLLSVATLISWTLGNLLGGLAGYYRKNRLLKLVGVIATALQPIPNYIMAFVLLVLLGYVWPVFPITGSAQINLARGFDWSYMSSVAYHAVLPVLSLVLVGIGPSFIGMRALVSNIVTEDYVNFAELGGVSRHRILMAYIMRNAMGPQLTALALSLGLIFNGAVITEVVFGYPGVGNLLIRAVYAGDYSLVIGIASISIIAVAAAVLVIDLLYPLIDPRVRVSS